MPSGALCLSRTSQPVAANLPSKPSSRDSPSPETGLLGTLPPGRRAHTQSSSLSPGPSVRHALFVPWALVQRVALNPNSQTPWHPALAVPTTLPRCTASSGLVPEQASPARSSADLGRIPAPLRLSQCTAPAAQAPRARNCESFYLCQARVDLFGPDASSEAGW